MSAVVASRKHRVAMLMVMLVLGACSGGETRLPTDTPPDTVGPPPGQVQKATLTLQVLPASSDSAISRQLGWTLGVPGALVTIQRNGSTASLSVTADAQGRLSVPDLLPGSYTVSALRLLSAEERGRLSDQDSDVDALGGGASVTVTAPGSQGSVSVLAGRRGSLVISEVYRAVPAQPGGTFYAFGQFFELYNNGDDPVPLAGKLIVKGFPGGQVENPPYVTCDQVTPFQNDPLGIWASHIYEFPPSASALNPGETLVLATDAIDHTKIAQNTYDLSGADFEFSGTKDTDNPSVPDMISVGTSSGADIPGHGLQLYSLFSVLAVAEPMSIAELPRKTHVLNTEYVRVPGDQLLDVITSKYNFPPPPFPLCGEPPVSRTFDRQESNALENLDSRSLQRVVLTRLSNGQKVLLRTKTSSRDFIAADPTPGVIP